MLNDFQFPIWIITFLFGLSKISEMQEQWQVSTFQHYSALYISPIRKVVIEYNVMHDITQQYTQDVLFFPQFEVCYFSGATNV